MHSNRYLLVLASVLPVILAGRGKLKGGPTTVCNEVPTQSPFVYAPKPTCYHVADPSGAMGYCPNLSAKGWCDCGTAGNYPNLPGNNVCGYTTLPSTTLALTKTNCATGYPKRDVVEPALVEPTSAPYVSIPERKRAERVEKRDGTITYSNCGDSPGGDYAKGGFTTKEAVLRQAYADARALAASAQNVAGNNVGFTNYFGGNLPDVQLTHFHNMMQAIASNDKFYTVEFECKNVPDCGTGKRGANSAMVTDATAGKAGDKKVIQVCPRFFTSTGTKYLLPQTKTTPSPPFRDLDNWCQKVTRGSDTQVSGRGAQWYATAGHTVLHELTHLDALAAKAGLEADGGQHGTLDAQMDGYFKGDTCELNGARNYLDAYKKDTTGVVPSPDYNAESYSAAATEIYFMAKCGFSRVQ